MPGQVFCLSVYMHWFIGVLSPRHLPVPLDPEMEHAWESWQVQFVSILRLLRA